jgi:P-type E1-E2 ATPase
VMFVARDATLLGLIAVADPIKTSTPAALEALRASGLKIVMLTGDNRTWSLRLCTTRSAYRLPRVPFIRYSGCSFRP